MGIVYTGRLNKFYELVKDAPRTCDYVQLTGLGGENERLVKHTEEPWYVTHWIRSDANKLRNNITREAFKAEVKRFFSGHVPESVKTAMKWDDFDGKGRTLSVRRIQDTFDAISAEVRTWRRDGGEQEDSVMSAVAATISKEGSIPDILRHINEELDYVERITPAGALPVRSMLAEIRTQLGKLYSVRGVPNQNEIIKFGKMMESFRQTADWVVSRGGAKICREHFEWAKYDGPFHAMWALQGLCARTVLRFMPRIGGGKSVFEKIGFPPYLLPEGRAKRLRLPRVVRDGQKVEGACQGVDMLYEKLKQFKRREGDGPSARGRFCTELVYDASLEYVTKYFVGKIVDDIADERLDQVLDEVWKDLQYASPAVISQLLGPLSEDLGGNEVYVINPTYEFDENKKKYLATKMQTLLDRIILNRYFASCGLPPLFVRQSSKPMQPKDLEKPAFDEVVKTGGADQKEKNVMLYGVLSKFYGSSPIGAKKDAPTLGDQFKAAVISRYMKKYGEYDKYGEQQEEDDIPVLNINQELRFQDDPVPDDAKLDQRATRFLDDLVKKSWQRLAGVLVQNEHGGVEMLESPKIYRFLGLPSDEHKAREFERVENSHLTEFDWNDEWEKTWKINPEYENDQELIGLLGKLERPIEKFIVNQLFVEFNMPPIYVNIATGASLPPIEQALRPEKG